MMKLSQLERVRGLQEELREAERVLFAFEQHNGPTVGCQAVSIWPDELHQERPARVELLPVSKEVAITAAVHARSKVVQQLAALGVEVDHPEQPQGCAQGSVDSITQPLRWIGPDRGADFLRGH